ncbi:unnamed protein product [Pelagomonas calceolata]|uniref:Uncharacterized protein n=1 Tax=Pelagomonas calceolata TaxID=35677 RepID=A0A8J2T0Z9_9STRA|nr:unnamed protein product [Pelagomonas calceolata]
MRLMITGVLGGRRARVARCEWEGRPASQAIFLAPAVDAAAVGDGEVVAVLEVGLGAHEAVAVRDAAALRAVRLVAVLRVDRLGLLVKLPLPTGVLAQAAADGVARRHARGAGQLLVGGGRGRGREGPDVGLAGGLVVDHRLAGHVAFALVLCLGVMRCFVRRIHGGFGFCGPGSSAAVCVLRVR